MEMRLPAAEQRWSNLALLRLSAFSFGLNGFIMAIDMIILPVLVLAVAPEGLRNTYVGLLGFSGLIAAAVVQPIVGRYSDRTHSRLGRRVPYLLWGCTFASLGLAGIGLASSYSSYLALFGIWLFIQVNANVAYGPYQALIPDLVPRHRIGIAASWKILSDAAGGLVLIALTGVLIGRYTGAASINWLWLTLGLLGVSLMVTGVITTLTVRSRETAAGPVPAPTRQPRRSAKVGLHPQLTR